MLQVPHEVPWDLKTHAYTVPSSAGMCQHHIFFLLWRHGHATAL